MNIDTLDNGGLALLYALFTHVHPPSPGITGTYTNRTEFLDTLRSLDQDRWVDEIRFCRDCTDVAPPMWRDDMTYLADGDSVCDSHADNYWMCYHCEEWYSSTTTVAGDTEVCESCLDDRYIFCEDCDEYFHRDSDHYHEQDCDCDVPGWPATRHFHVRNDGNEPLASDTPATITLPAGEISEQGLLEIALAIRNHCAEQGYVYHWSYRESEYKDHPITHMWGLSMKFAQVLGSTWQTREGNYTKRLSRWAYNEKKVKFPPELLSQIGNIGAAHSGGVDVKVEFTRRLNESPSYFYHEGSCWWSDYNTGRCALKSNGGFGMRALTREPNSWGEVECVGRAWVMPLRLKTDTLSTGRLQPTFETLNPDAYVVFNGYGTLENYSPARILAQMTGWTYRKIGFECHPMYINAGGYLVGPEETVAPYTDGFLGLDVDTHSLLFTTEQEQAREKIDA